VRGSAAANLLAMVLENGRLSAMSEIAAQFQALVDAETGISQARVDSAFPLDDAQLAELRATMERRFGRKLEMTVAIDPELIGGVRVAVGDEVLDTSIRARLEQMKAALVA
jgi:F-type H+-transporting ATPase subunit delta